VTGGDGILATALRPYFPHADWLSRQSCDVADGGSVKRWFSQHSYDVIVHAAAETNASADPAALSAVNIGGTANITHWARKQGARLVYCSTDYVYAGHGNHKETDPVQPHNEYARSKLGGEMVARSYTQTLVIRGSWYSTLQYAKAAHDAYTSRQNVDHAAPTVAALSVSTHTGVVNVGGPRRSIYEICVTEFNPGVFMVPRHQVQPAPPPKDVSLDCTKARRWLS
jgi:dTDP-4-dehydrorhamnose reductase